MISFAEAHPELVSEWAESNGDYGPEKISYGSNQKITWIGKCGHEWEATVKNRSNGSGCPYCSGNQVLYGYNDLASAYPKLASEWSELNYPLLPSAVTVKANRKVWWRCRCCGQQWQARIADRTDGHGCPVCAGKKLVAGVNDFVTEHPEIASEWSSRNDKLAALVRSKSRENVWWQCHICGYVWRAVIDSRVKGQNCPVCADRAVKRGFNDLATIHPELFREWNQDRNGTLKPTQIVASSHRSVYWKGKCGHVWYAPIHERVAGAECPICEAFIQNEIKVEAVKYYARKAEVEFFENDDSPIGIPIQIYMPKQKLAIEFSPPADCKGVHRKWENGKNWLCLNSGIRLVRILSQGAVEFDNCICITRTDDSYDVLSVAIIAAFNIGGIQVDVNVERDLYDICDRLIIEPAKAYKNL
ncbi:MAG: zinc-ribbon domain-containing protein [Lachnospiraceae bacterium]|nr:zinc-ribbon domain-containing protein [Lachnospiraceae bacterium]